MQGNGPDSDNGQYRKSEGSHASDTPSLRSMPTLSIAAARLESVVAAHQFQTLARYGAESLVSTSLSDERRAQAARRAALVHAFIEHGAAEFDSNLYSDILKFNAASQAIRAKAASLGYGLAANTVEITAVPGGFVGRFGGNDIYASTR
jgi:hypothetical protein